MPLKERLKCTEVSILCSPNQVGIRIPVDSLGYRQIQPHNSCFYHALPNES